MADETISNLEPIEDGDLNLRDKFIGGGKKVESFRDDLAGKIESVKTPETFQERSERKEGAVEKEGAYAKILSKVPVKTNQDEEHDVKKDAEVANAGIDAQGKIENLVKIAETKGVFHAVKVAKHLENFYILDEFHDKLLGEELHEALIKKGLIKEI